MSSTEDIIVAAPSNRSCWICKSKETKVWKHGNLGRDIGPKDLKITDGRYGVTLTLFRCSSCGFIFADGNEVKNLTALYEQLVDVEYERGIENRALQMSWLVDLGLSQRPNAKKVLEIGAGLGLLIREAQSRGLDAVGIEPSSWLVAAAMRLGIELLQGVFPHPKLEHSRFDLIYIVDVIEHVSDPVGLMRASAKALTPGGALIIVTPDIKSVTARVLGHKWWHLRLAHVGYFDGYTMRLAADAAGLNIVVKKRAIWFFPLEYLAERMSVYLPVGPLLRRTQKLFAKVYKHVVKVNLRDSTVFILTNEGSRCLK